MASIVSNDAESNRVRRVEQVAAEGKAALESMRQTFTTVQELLRGWQKDLGDLQGRADEALRKAQDAHTTVSDSSAQIGALGTFAAVQKKQDAQGKAKKALLMQEMAAAQAAIDAAQQTVDDLRGEYERKSSAVVAAYVLNVSGLWSADGKASGAGGFGASVADVKDTLLGQLSESKVRELEDAAAHAGDGPGQYEAYLKLLAGLDAKALGEFFSVRPELARYPLSGTGDAVWDTATVKAWWGKLGADQQQALVQNASGVVGNLNGVPYGARDEANRMLLRNLQNDSSVTGNETTKKALDELGKAASNVDDEGKPIPNKRFILALDISNIRPNNEDDYDYNNVLATVSVGDVDLANYTTIAVPGMANTVQDSMVNNVNDANNIYNRQTKDLDATGKSSKHATIAFMGYETPPATTTAIASGLGPTKYIFDTNSVLDDNLARQGGLKLASFTDGINVTKSQNAEIPEHGIGKTGGLFKSKSTPHTHQLDNGPTSGKNMSVKSLQI